MLVRGSFRSHRGARDESEYGGDVAIASRSSGPVGVVRATVLLATICLGGCSFAFARRPPQYYGGMASFECTKSVGPAVVDTTLATMYGALTAGNEVARLHGDGAWFVGSSGFSILLGTTAAVYGASAAWGFIAAHECRDALKHSVELTPEPILP